MQSTRAAALAASQGPYDDVDYDPPTSPSPPPRSPSPTPTPAPRRPRQASPELAQRLRDRTLSEPVQRQGRSALCSAPRVAPGRRVMVAGIGERACHVEGLVGIVAAAHGNLCHH